MQLIEKKTKPVFIVLFALVLATFFLNIAVVADKTGTYEMFGIKGYEALTGFNMDIYGNIVYQQPSSLTIISFVASLMGLVVALLIKKSGDRLAISLLLGIVSALGFYFQNNEYFKLLQRGITTPRGLGNIAGLILSVVIVLVSFYILRFHSRKLNGDAWFWLFLGPCLIALSVVVVVPTVIGLFYSFTTWDGINEMKLSGVTNFKNLFQDKLFWQSFLFTGKFALFAVVLINGIGLALAMLVTSKFKGKNALRTTLYIPNLIGGLILGYIWYFIFTDIFATIGTVLKMDGLKIWLSTTETGFWGMLILSVWQMAGYMMVIYIAYLENVPEDLIEAARIDGANKLQVFRHITFPLIIPAFTINTFLTLSNSFKLFDQNLALTNGAPGNTTQMLALNIYRTAYAENKMAYAQAKALVFFLIVGLLSMAQVYFSKKREVEL